MAPDAPAPPSTSAPGTSLLLLFAGRITVFQPSVEGDPLSVACLEVDYVVKKYKKDAIVILVIGAIMIIALVLMAYNGIMQMIYAENYGFSPLC